LYEWSVVAFALVVPAVGLAAQVLMGALGGHTIAYAALAWFVFGAIGLRLGSAGIKQVVTPEFTAGELLGIRGGQANHLVREVGFANICFGVLGILQLFLPGYRLPAAIAGGLYLALAGAQHAVRYARARAAGGETFPMVSDLLIVLMLVVLLVMGRL
jgi:hypothetical protein